MAYGVLKIFFKKYGTGKLLGLLFADNEHSQAAWEEFLGRYSGLILKVCWKYEKDYDKVMQRYLYVCERLVENQFRLLKKFNSDFKDSTPKFSNWLISVVRNICIDFHRKEHGRNRYPAAILQLPEEDRQFFKLYYWKGMTLSEITETLNLSEGNAEENASEKLDRINSLLLREPQKKMKAEFIRFNEEIYDPGDYWENEDYEGKINGWIAELSPAEKIVVRLRFWNGLKAREISDILKIKPYNKVYSILNSALKELREKSKNNGTS